jgi:HSP90 family molecular chaperone
VVLSRGLSRSPIASRQGWIPARVRLCTKVEPIEEPAEPKPAHPAEAVTGVAASHNFQAETAQLLQIVAKSLYKDKEVFLRELISNAADATEKRRYLMRTGAEGLQQVDEEEIEITTNSDDNTITIADSGIGMTETELHSNLGQIASSGTKTFVQEQGDSSTADLIGQFGVGFYSVFMVSDDVKVFTRSAKEGEPSFCWSCQGAGGAYSVAAADNVSVGAKIVIQLNEDNKSFSDESYVREIIQKYSNFVGSKIKLNGTVVNTVEPLWTLDKNKVTDEQHEEFYRYLTKAWDKPQQHLWYAADAPLSVKALLYIPGHNKEKFGMGRQDAGVNVYCRKILIEAQSEAILPDWLRFVKGVVDSEDVPLNISRETMQDSALIRQLNKAVTGRVIRWLADIGKKEPDTYKTIFTEFGHYIKEGVVVDPSHKKALLPLLRFGSSAEDNKLHSFSEYVERMPDDQDKIYYLSASDYENAISSPYYEVFKQKGYEVLFMHEEVDDFLMREIPEFDGKKFQNAEEANIDLTGDKDVQSISKEDRDQLCEWIKEVLGDRVHAVRATTRLVDSPSIVVNHDSPTMRKLAKLQGIPLPSRQELEINVDHAIVSHLNRIRRDDSQKELSSQVARQLLDNSLLAAGVMEDSREMVQRLNKLLEQCLTSNK